MLGRLTGVLVVAALALPGAAAADTVWLCEPGTPTNPCRDSLETTVEAPDGRTSRTNPPLPADPPVDCFYVYPTVSQQPGLNADKSIEPQQVAIAQYQASRFSQRCRVFAPMYRQLTLLGLQRPRSDQAAGLRLAYGDVRDAWLDYLRNHNRGRGVVLIGHSQGTRMLRQLVRTEIDPKPAVRRRLVSAILLGGNVTVRRDQTSGGDFKHIATCTRPGQAACVVAFSTYNETPPANARYGRAANTTADPFGFPAGPEYEVACTDPSRLAGRTGPLETLFRSEPFPGVLGVLLVEMYGGPQPSAPTPWIRPRDRYTGRCLEAEGANFLMIEPVGSARRLNPAPEPGWGLHLADVNLPLGELVEAVGLQTRTYLRQRATRARTVTRRARVGRRGRVRLRVACAGEPGTRCAGRLRLRRRGVAFGSRRYSVAAGKRSRVVVRLPRRARRVLRRRGHLRVRAVLRDTGGAVDHRRKIRLR